MKYNDILPLGSLVLLKEAEPQFRLQVIGYAQVKADNSKFFDYAGVVYANGYEDRDKVILFNHEDIDKIFSVGYLDDDMRKYLKGVKEFIEDVRSGKADLQELIKKSEYGSGRVN